MSRLVPDRFLPYTLGKWLQKSHNTEIGSFDARNKKVVAQIKKTYLIFKKVNMTSRRTNDDSFIYSETLPIYVEEQVLITVSWQRYKSNVVFLQGYREVEDLYFVQSMTTKKVINDRYIRANNYENKQEFNDIA